MILQSITPGMTRIIQGTGVGVTHWAGDGLSEFPSDLADAGTAVSAAAISVQASDASALVTRGSDASALRMRVLVAVSAAAVADSMIRPAAFRSDRQVKTSRAAFRKIGRLT
jgi:hypothetical protein